MIYCIGKVVDHQSEGSGESLEFEEEVLNAPLMESAAFPDQTKWVKCGCCGQRLKYACKVVHTPTHTGYFVGRDCVTKIVSLRRRFSVWLVNSSVALLERAKCAAN